MLPYIVVDASVTGAWLFPEPDSLRTRSIQDAIYNRRVNALSPDRFAEEVMRICQKKTDGAIYSDADTWDMFLDVITSPIVLLPSYEVHERTWELAFELKLTIHDALYVAIAEQWDVELWTLDNGMGSALVTSKHPNVHHLHTDSFPY